MLTQRRGGYKSSAFGSPLAAEFPLVDRAHQFKRRLGGGAIAAGSSSDAGSFHSGASGDAKRNTGRKCQGYSG